MISSNRIALLSFTSLIVVVIISRHSSSIVGEDVDVDVVDFSHLKGRMFQGDYANFRDNPWVVQIGIKYRCNGTRNITSNFFCTGTLIRKDLILTAGHCLFDSLNYMTIQKCRELADERLLRPLHQVMDNFNTTAFPGNYRLWPLTWMRIYIGYPLNWLIHDVAIRTTPANRDVLQNWSIVNTSVIAAYLHPLFRLGHDAKTAFHDVALLQIPDVEAIHRERKETREAALVRKALKVSPPISRSTDRLPDVFPLTAYGWPSILNIAEDWLVNYKPAVQAILDEANNFTGLKAKETLEKYLPKLASTAMLQRLTLRPTIQKNCYFRKVNLTQAASYSPEHQFFCLQAERENSGPCSGDSGGPLYRPFDKNKVELFGTVSFGPKSCVAKADDPAVVVRLSGYRDFLDRVLGGRHQPIANRTLSLLQKPRRLRVRTSSSTASTIVVRFSSRSQLLMMSATVIVMVTSLF